MYQLGKLNISFPYKPPRPDISLTLFIPKSLGLESRVQYMAGPQISVIIKQIQDLKVMEYIAISGMNYVIVFKWSAINKQNKTWSKDLSS